MSVANEFFKENVICSVRVGTTSPSDITKWCKPSPPFVKINFYGSVINSVAVGGFVVKIELRNPLIARALNLGHNTINVVEALALQELSAGPRGRIYLILLSRTTQR
ncbi:hypothetical protein ACFX19_041744 [Malus domestica]